jgi:hypothetical protein
MRSKGRCRAFKPMEPRGWFIGVAADFPRVATILASYGYKHESTVRNVSSAACKDLICGD